HQLTGECLTGYEPRALRDAVEGVPKEGIIGGPRLGQFDTSCPAAEECRPETTLKSGNLMADGRLGYGQLLGGGAKAPPTRSGFEGPERCQRRKHPPTVKAEDGVAGQPIHGSVLHEIRSTIDELTSLVERRRCSENPHCA